MHKRPLKNSKERKTDEVLSPCPLCGTTYAEKETLSALDALLRSHLELCAILRSVGRRMLRSENEDNVPSDRLRKALRRAENIQHMLKSPEAHPKGVEGSEATDYSASWQGREEPLTDEATAPNDFQRRTRLTRPRSLRIVRLPPA
jgi:hypothetical protein